MICSVFKKLGLFGLVFLFYFVCFPQNGLAVAWNVSVYPENDDFLEAVVDPEGALFGIENVYFDVFLFDSQGQEIGSRRFFFTHNDLPVLREYQTRLFEHGVSNLKEARGDYLYFTRISGIHPLLPGPRVERAIPRVELANGNSYDFSEHKVGQYTGGDFYLSELEFYANNIGQRGLKGLGDIGKVSLGKVAIPANGYTRFGVPAVVGHTYVSLAQEGEEGSYIVFRVTSISGGSVTINYEYLEGYQAKLEVKQRPDPSDLLVADVSYSPTSPQIGDDITFHVSVRNQGGVGASNVEVYIKDQGTWGKVGTIPFIRAGQTRSISLTLYAAPINAERFLANNPHLFVATVDPTARIDESNENNNQHSLPPIIIGEAAEPE